MYIHICIYKYIYHGYSPPPPFDIAHVQRRNFSKLHLTLQIKDLPSPVFTPSLPHRYCPGEAAQLP